MSLEAKIEALTAAMVNLTTIMQGAAITPNAPAAPVVPQPAPAPAFVPPAAPVAAPPAAPAMPAPPAFAAAPAAAPAAPAGLPFHDAVSLAKYATEAWESIKGKDPEVGPKIQAAFTTLGYQDISQIQPQHYQEFFNRVESLR